jgi:hypothetical protein
MLHLLIDSLIWIQRRLLIKIAKQVNVLLARSNIFLLALVQHLPVELAQRL